MRLVPATVRLLCLSTLEPQRRVMTTMLERRENWMEADSSTIFGRARSPARDANLSEDDDFTVLDLEVITRALGAIKRRGEQISSNAAAEDEDAIRVADEGFTLQSSRNSAAAEHAFLRALSIQRSCGAAWYGLGSLLHEHQHGGLDDERGDEGSDAARTRRLALAADCALIAARYEASQPRALALLGDVLNDLGSHREACRAWTAAEARGKRHWRGLAAPWLVAAGDGGSAFGPREPLRSLAVGAEPMTLHRSSSGQAFTARRLSGRPAAFLLSGFSTADERDAIVAAGIGAPMREVPRAEEDAPEDDDRRGCEVAWLASPVTCADTSWAALMRDAIDVVLPSSNGLPDAGAPEDLHVVKYAPGGAYGLHLDATCAVPRAVTVLHYLNDVGPGATPGFGGETWLPLADAAEGSAPPQAGEDGVLVPPRAGDALVFFSFDDHGDVEGASLHGGRPASETKWVGNQWIRLAIEQAPPGADSTSGGGQDEDEEQEAPQPPLLLPRGPGFGPRVIG